MKKTLQQHLAANGSSKRIQSLAGGGIRGALTLGYLKRIETILQEKHGKDYLLGDHFDLVGGTSTGSIIAAVLAVRKIIYEFRDLYLELACKIFRKKKSFRTKYCGEI